MQSLSLREWIEVTEKRMELTHRQGVMVRLMLTLPWNGNSNAAIARQMRVKVSTVDKQIERLFKALGVHSRMQLAQRVDAEIAATPAPWVSC